MKTDLEHESKITSFDGFTHSSNTISFTLTNTSGTWASAADVLIANAGGFAVGAHIFVTSSPANAANGALATGFAATGGGTPVGPRWWSDRDVAGRGARCPWHGATVFEELASKASRSSRRWKQSGRSSGRPLCLYRIAG